MPLKGLTVHSRIGIAGCGGIGSNVAMYLIRSGIRHLRFVDFDVVEPSNLNRQFYFKDQIGIPKVDALKTNLLRIDPQADLESQQLVLDSRNIRQVFEGCDLIVEAFDKANSKVMLVEAFTNTDIPVIGASGVAGLSLKDIQRKDLGNNLTIFGDFYSDVEEYKVFSPKISIITALMANEILVRIGFNEKNE